MKGRLFPKLEHILVLIVFLQNWITFIHSKKQLLK